MSVLFWVFAIREVGKSLKLSFSLTLCLSLCVSGGEDFQKGLVDGGSRNAAQVG